MEDIWAAPRQVKSHKMEQYKTGFSLKDSVNVKQVINPKGGLSYNPSHKDHKLLLKNVAVKEEELVKANLKELRKSHPLLYAENKGDSEEANSGEENDKESDSDSDSSNEEIDIVDVPVGKTVDRLDIKTTAQRNKESVNKKKV